MLLNIIFRLNTENVIKINIQIMRRYKFHLKINFPLISGTKELAKVFHVLIENIF